MAITPKAACTATSTTRENVEGRDVTRYSQNDEEDVLREHFRGRRDGRFLDVGAWSGKCFSNTFGLAQRGWSGVCVEPGPKAFCGLLENYRGRPDIELANVAVAPEAGLATFYDADGDALSTLHESQLTKWPQTQFRRFTVATVTPGMLLDRFGCDFDLLSLDVEGNSADLLREFPLDAMPRLAAIVVEHDGRADELRDWVMGRRFYEISRNGENVIFVR